jgi:hypothetical protein
MNLEYKDLLPEDFSPQSKVWIYQSSRLFSLGEALELETKINDFCNEWQSHGDKVKAFGTLFFGQFILLMADDSVSVSGCSTDSSVRFIKSIGENYKVDLFNRTNLAFLVKDKIQVLPLSQVKYAAENGFLTSDTLYFNNLVQTKKELENNWIIPVKDSWLAPKLQAIAR